jgi:RNA polymerase sigma factor (sigma-70 family)
MPDQQTPLTRLTLISALREGLRWEEFLALYGRLILFWGRRDFGLQESDAENLRQEVLIRVWKSIRGYDPARGRFHNWLYVCTRNAVRSLWRSRRGEWVGSDRPEVRDRLDSQKAPPPAAWNQLPGDAGLDEAVRLWEEEGVASEGLQGALRLARARVQASTWKAFLLFEFFEMTAKEIAPRLGLKPSAVNQAVHRVRQLLQQTLAVKRPPRSGLKEKRP